MNPLLNLNVRGLGNTGDDKGLSRAFGFIFVIGSLIAIIVGSWYLQAHKDDPYTNDKTIAIVFIILGIIFLILSCVVLYFNFKD